MEKRIQKAIAEMTMYDHEYMRLVMDGNKVLAQKMIQVDLNRTDLMIISVKCEVTKFNVKVDGKDCRLDIVAKDTKGKLSDCSPGQARGGSK